MTMNYWELDKIVPVHPCSCVQHRHHLKYLRHGPSRVSCCTGLNTHFLHYTTGHWVTRSIFLHPGGATMDLLSISSRPPAQPHNMSWDGNPRSIPGLLFHIRKMSPLHQRYNVTMWKLLSAADHSADFTRTSLKKGMASEPTGNSRHRHFHKVLGSHIIGWDVHCPRSWDWKDRSPPNS